LNAQKYGFLRGHVRCDDAVPEIRFFWMGRER
jgi:hypothetical protein